MPNWIITVALLIASNIFMTYAWYFHLKKPSWTMIVAIVASWGLAFFEYCLQVPANRIGHISHGGPFSAPQLKIIQEAITLSVFIFFSNLVLGEKIRVQDGVALALIFAGVVVGMWGRR